MKTLYCIIGILGVVYALHGMYGVLIGIQKSHAKFTESVNSAIGMSSEPTDAYGRRLYKELKALPDQAKKSMEIYAYIQIGLGVSVSVFCLVLFMYTKPNEGKSSDRLV